MKVRLVLKTRSPNHRVTSISSGLILKAQSSNPFCIGRPHDLLIPWKRPEDSLSSVLSYIPLDMVRGSWICRQVWPPASQ